MTELDNMLQIANIQTARLNMALDKLSKSFPFTKEKITTMTEDELLLTDFLIHRFGKL
jgi:hypothetical protein